MQKQLNALAAHLSRRRGELLQAWREAVRQDPELTTSSHLPRGALDDHIPRILEDFERRLRAEHALDAAQIEVQERLDAAEHGMHRWQQGYDLRETMREWGHLQSVLMGELDGYAATQPALDPQVLPTARGILMALCMEGTCESASRYARLQQAEAASRLRDLEVSLNALQALEQERASLLRETAQDLRGSVSAIANTSALLANDGLQPAQRASYDLLQERIQSVEAMLADMVELARLEAGQDPLKLEEFDVAQRVRAYCETLRPAAAARGLFLKYEGPDSLPVQCDALKLQRILQNLLLNALEATPRGGVIVRCSELADRDPPQWQLLVQDTGPGFALQAAAPLRHALKDATEHAPQSGNDAAPSPPNLLAAESGPGSASTPSGEGIGLSIVKRLSDLLDATLELETAPGHGTTIQVTFPLAYRPR